MEQRIAGCIYDMLGTVILHAVWDYKKPVRGKRSEKARMDADKFLFGADNDGCGYLERFCSYWLLPITPGYIRENIDKINIRKLRKGEDTNG